MFIQEALSISFLDDRFYFLLFCVQFFITLGENIDYLDKVHTVFGEVAEGFDVLDKINNTFVDTEHRPYKDVR